MKCQFCLLNWQRQLPATEDKLGNTFFSKNLKLYMPFYFLKFILRENVCTYSETKLSECSLHCSKQQKISDNLHNKLHKSWQKLQSINTIGTYEVILKC